MKIKIAHVLDNFHVGGVQNVVVDLLNGLDERLFDHSVCCIRHIGDARFKVHRRDITYYDLMKEPKNDLRMPFKLAKVFLKARPHIVHTTNWGTIDGVIAAKLAMVPFVVHTEHGRDTMYLNGEPRRRVLLRKLLFRSVDVVSTVSEELQEYYQQLTGFTADRIRVIHNGVDVRRFNAFRVNRPDKRKELGFQEDDFVIGAVGRLDSVKDHMTLLKAFAALAPRYDQLRLIIIGDGPLRQDLAIYVRDHGLKEKVLLPGTRADVPELLRLMDLFVLCSLSEGMSITLLEAMASERAIVASNVGGNPLLIASGQSGLLVPAGDSAALAGLIQQVVRDPALRARLGRAARKRVEAKFSLTAMVENYTDLYVKLMEKKGWNVNPSKSNAGAI